MKVSNKKLFEYIYIFIVLDEKRQTICTSLIKKVLLVILIFVFAAIGSPLVVKSFSQTKRTTTHYIGDFSSKAAIIDVNSTIFSINITLLEPGEETANVYLQSIKPTVTTVHLQQVTITDLSGPYRYNYNYYQADYPIYLLSNSKLIYRFSVNTMINSSCPAQLYLFDNELMYFNFKNYKIFKATTSHCIQKNKAKPVTFDITKPSSYYVAIEIYTGIVVSSKVSAVQVYYNITDLELKDPNYRLSSNNRSCVISTCPPFYCKEPWPDRHYIVIVPSDVVHVEYNLSSPSIHGWYIALFVIGLVLVAMTLLLLCVVICFLCCRFCILTFKQNYHSL